MNQGMENLQKHLSKFKSKDKRAPENKYTGYIFTGRESKEQCTGVRWRLWPVLMNTPVATLTVPWFKQLRAAFLDTPIKEPQQFCPERLPIYTEYHSPSLGKRLGKGHTFLKRGLKLFPKNVTNGCSRMFSVVLLIWMPKHLITII